jgi:hypothetical protein
MPTTERLTRSEKLERIREAIEKHEWLGALLAMDEQGNVTIASDTAPGVTASAAKKENPAVPTSPAYYDEIRAQAKRQNEAVSAWRPPR